MIQAAAVENSETATRMVPLFGVASSFVTGMAACTLPLSDFVYRGRRSINAQAFCWLTVGSVTRVSVSASRSCAWNPCGTHFKDVLGASNVKLMKPMKCISTPLRCVLLVRYTSSERAARAVLNATLLFLFFFFWWGSRSPHCSPTVA